MTATILTIIASLLTCAIGIWKYLSRKNAERRRLADEAGKKLESAHKNHNKSDLLDAWDGAGRMR